MFLSLNDGRRELYQWDNGRTAAVAVECEAVHFSNLKYGESLPVEVKGGEVAIPNKLLMSGEKIYCWAFVEDEHGAYTREEQTIGVIKRPKPSDYVYTETEIVSIKNAVDDALQEAKESGDFKGEKGDDYVLTEQDKADIAKAAAKNIDPSDIPADDQPIQGSENLVRSGGVYGFVAEASNDIAANTVQNAIDAADTSPTEGSANIVSSGGVYDAIGEVYGYIGSIDEAIDGIIAIQESLIGTIAFTIEGVEYSALGGMTWYEWVNSSYNTDGLVTVYQEDDTGISKLELAPDGDGFVNADGEYQYPYTAIVNGGEYFGD